MRSPVVLRKIPSQVTPEPQQIKWRRRPHQTLRAVCDSPGVFRALVRSASAKNAHDSPIAAEPIIA